ncbi:MAG: response regulator, partial [Steroidobacteraceae bacterium]
MRSVLVVDDNVDNRVLVSTLIAHRGHRPLVASDGAEALEVLRRERPALVISDILMPTMDGYELVREMRKDPALANTKVVFYTAHYHQREARSLADSCGVARVLAKPCEPEELMLVIDRMLSEGEQPGQRPVEEQFDREHLKLMTDVLAEKADQLESANARLKALTELNLRLSSERDMHALLRSVCRGARELIGARYAVLVVREKSQGSAIFTTTSGIASPGLLAVPALEASPLAAVLTEGKTLRLEHLGGDPRKAGLPAGYPSAHAMVAAPVASLAKVYGWLCLVN